MQTKSRALTELNCDNAPIKARRCSSGLVELDHGRIRQNLGMEATKILGEELDDWGCLHKRVTSQGREGVNGLCHSETKIKLLSLRLVEIELASNRTTLGYEVV